MEIKVGDKVKLRSGGPVMIVSLVVGQPGPMAVAEVWWCKMCPRRRSSTRRISIGSGKAAGGVSDT